jgi:hypothetical protein
MALTYNDIQTRSLLRYQQGATDSADVLPAGTRIFVCRLVAATVLATATIHNAATTAGTDAINLQASASGGGVQFTMAPHGTVFDVGVSCVVVGAGALLELYYMVP